MRMTNKNKLSVLLIFYLLPTTNLVGQNIPRPLNKVGGFINFNHPSGFAGYFISLENERVFNRNYSFTHGPRLDYDKSKRDVQKNFSGTENLVLGYELKYYPFHHKSSKLYQGIFIGIYPCYFLPINNLYKNGPGLASPIGYQYVFKDRISLGIETSIIYMQNVNESSPYRTNSQDRYFYITPAIKFGFKLGANKS
jgi:hypothetical protein